MKPERGNCTNQGNMIPENQAPADKSWDRLVIGKVKKLLYLINPQDESY